MAVEQYMREGSLLVSDERLTERKARQQLLSETGFEQVLSYEETQVHRLEMAKLVFTELTGKELTMWRRFLPTTVSTEQYRFDQPPTEVLEVIKAAQAMQCFDRIEIWTPEGNNVRGAIARVIKRGVNRVTNFLAEIDPMAVGVINGADNAPCYYPIVRWGESLLPVKRIKAHVRHTRLGVRTVATLLAMVILAALGGAVFGIAAMAAAFGWWLLLCAAVVVIVVAWLGRGVYLLW